MVEWAKRFATGISGVIILVFVLLHKNTVHLLFVGKIITLLFNSNQILLVTTILGKKELN